MVNRYNSRNNMQKNAQWNMQRDNFGNNSGCCNQNERARNNCNTLGNCGNMARNNVNMSQNNGNMMRNDDNMSGNCAMNTDCRVLMQKLQKLDFSIVDTALYLNMYPECQKALAHYNMLLEERAEIRKMLAKKCKRPMSAFENDSETSWDWISSPWPWDISAN